ncbi:MAG TPA: hypothetical protein VKV79_03130 [Terriglobia bacterium]|nr:hypothetical protein [Terriglobia bacterium]
MSQSETDLAMPQDFAASRNSEARVERVTLPKLGKPVLMRRPQPLWFVFHQCLPQTLAASMEGASHSSPPTPDDVGRLAGWILALLSEVMVRPRVSLSPGPEEISPDLISDEDLNFIIRWAMGEVVVEAADSSSVSDLAPFCGQRSSAPSEPSSSHMELPPQ